MNSDYVFHNFLNEPYSTCIDIQKSREQLYCIPTLKAYEKKTGIQLTEFKRSEYSSKEKMIAKLKESREAFTRYLLADPATCVISAFPNHIRFLKNFGEGRSSAIVLFPKTNVVKKFLPDFFKFGAFDCWKDLYLRKSDSLKICANKDHIRINFPGAYLRDHGTVKQMYLLEQHGLIDPEEATMWKIQRRLSVEAGMIVRLEKAQKEVDEVNALIASHQKDFDEYYTEEQKKAYEIYKIAGGK